MAHFPQIGDTFGAYEITGEIGQGGMGVVFAARQTGLDRTVALKVLAPQFAQQGDYRERFIREAAALAHLDSPHVIHVYDHGEHDGCLFIATQYVAGGDLGRLLRTNGALPLAAAAAVTGQMASALSDAHRVGIVHRDVKPTNILLRPAGGEPFAYLCDFGIAQGAQADLTVPGSVAGTLAYLSPERCRGEAATPASDLYALGCVLVAAVRGTAPYAGSDVEIGMQHLHAAVPQLPGHDPATQLLNHVLRRSLAKAPQDRYPDADTMRADLRRLEQTAAGRAPGHSGTAGAVMPAVPPLPAPQGGSTWGGGTGPHGPLSSGSGHVGSGAFPVPGGPAGPPRRRTALWVGAAVAAALVVGAVVTGVALTRGDGDEARSDAAASDTTGASSDDPSTDDPTDGPTDEPTDDAPTTGGTGPLAGPLPAATAADPADGTLVDTGAFAYRVPQGWVQSEPVNPQYSSQYIATEVDVDFYNNINTIASEIGTDVTMNQVAVETLRQLQLTGATDGLLEGIFAVDGVNAAFVTATLQAAADVDMRLTQFTALKDGMAYTVTISQSTWASDEEAEAEVGAIVATFDWAD